MNDTCVWTEVATPLGPMVLAGDGDALCGAWFPGQRHFAGVGGGWRRTEGDPLLRTAAGQLAAYFAGRAFGRRKLAPLVSPGKTWEGVIGGLVAVAIYAAALVPFASDAGYRGTVSPPAVAAWIAFALALASLSVVGDLFESWQKRVAGVKDSGSLLPGHGGVLDRIDALVAAMPPAALAAHWFLRD